MALSTSDIILLAIVGLAAVYFLFKDSLFVSSGTVPAVGSGAATPKVAETGGSGRDFVAALKESVGCFETSDSSTTDRMCSFVCIALTEKEAGHILWIANGDS